MTNSHDPLGAIVISDLHLNHPKVSTHRMVDSLIKNVNRMYVKDVTKYLIIAGDVFDRATQTDTVAGKQITRFIAFTLDFAFEYDLLLYVLRGTGSHDGTQSEHFVAMNEGRMNKVDLLYIDKISIWEDKYGISWLGVPDESTPSASQTQAEIQSLMKERGVSRVDMGLTHGLYNTHMLNGIMDAHAHDTSFYCSVVDMLIINGHIHHPSQYEKLLTIGSHDRNRHGEEEPKGGWRLLIDKPKKKVSVEFMENTEAELFTTYTLEATEMKAATREVNKYLSTSPLLEGGFLRIFHTKDININDLVRKLQERYSPVIEIVARKIEDKNKKSDLNDRVIEFEKISTVPITPNTAVSLLEDKLDRMGITDKDKILAAFKTL